MVPKLTRYKAQVLLAAGLPQPDVARECGIGVRTVRRISKEPAVTSLDGQERRGGRPSKTEGFRKFVAKTLVEEPHLLSVELLRRARLRGYEGRKSAFYAMVKEVRPDRPSHFITRFEGLPGEFSQHDFGQVEVTYDDGTTEVIQFFASRLKWSRFAAISLVPDQTAESLVRSLARHFVAFGGVPLRCVFDRPKTVAVRWKKNGEVTQWNHQFGHAMVELGFVPELCWAYAPEQKGSVENIVGWVKGSFFKQRRFVDREDLEAQLEEWHREINHERPSRATGEIPEARRLLEQPRFRPLRTFPEDFAFREPIRVGPMATVRFDGVDYAMPPESAGLSGTLMAYEDHLVIRAGKHERRHERRTRGSAPALSVEHRAERLAALSGKRGKTYLKRQHLLDLGVPAEQFLTELVHRRPWDWYPMVDQLHALLQSYGDARMTAALEQAVANQTLTVNGVMNALLQPTLFEVSA